MANDATDTRPALGVEVLLIPILVLVALAIIFAPPVKEEQLVLPFPEGWQKKAA